MANGELRFADRKGLELYTKLRNHKKRIQQGEKAYIKDTPYIWDGEQWCEYKAPVVEMSLYDMNEQLVRQLPDFSHEDRRQALTEINAWDTELEADAYMLLCKEQSYFTVLLPHYPDTVFGIPNLGVAVFECLESIGTVKSVNKLEDNTFEAWVIDENETVWCLHLFDYSQGIVRFGYEK